MANSGMGSAAVLAKMQLTMDCLDLRKRGFSIPAVAQRLGISPTAVRKHIEDAVTSMEAVKSEDAAHLRELDLARLDELYIPMHEKAIRGDPRALQACLSIMERRARLAGMDKPTVVEKHITLSEVIPQEQLTLAAQQYLASLREVGGPVILDANAVEVASE